jgi:hypothetical protein
VGSLPVLSAAILLALGATPMPSERMMVRLVTPAGAGAELVSIECRDDEGRQVAGLPAKSAAKQGEGEAESSSEGLFFLPRPPSCTRAACLGEGWICSEVPLDDGEVVLEVRPAGRLEARVGAGRAERGPERLLVQAWPSDAIARAPFLSRAAVAADGRVALELPLGRWDLRLAAPGWAPIYRFGLDVGRQPVALGALDFQRGSSVSGFLRAGGDEILVAGGAVSLRRPVSADGTALTSEGRLATATTLTAAVAGDGFFQILGAPPGVYELEVRAPGAATLVVPDVAVAADGEVSLGELWLQGALTLAVEVVPPRTPDGRPWQLAVRPVRARAEEGPAVHTDELGRAEITELDPGVYALHVRDEEGADLEVREIEIVAPTTERVVLDLVRVEGRVRLNGEPLAAELTAHPGHLGVARFQSNEEGRIAGWSRRPLTRQVVVEVAARAADEGGDEAGDEAGAQVGDRAAGQAAARATRFHRRVVVSEPDVDEDRWRLDLELEEGTLAGRVRNREGDAVADAEVLAVPLAEPLAMKVRRSDGQGRFAIDLVPGRQVVRARHPDQGASQEVSVDVLAGGTTPEVELVLEPQRTLRGRVVGAASGQGIPGARVAVESVGGAAAGASATTGLDGSFEIAVDEVATQLAVSVLVAGQAPWAACLDTPSADPWILAIDEGPGGALTVETTQDPGRPPATGGFLVLVNDRGGWLAPAVLFSVGSWQPSREQEGERRSEHFRSLAPGRWAAMWVATGTAPASLACARAWPADLDWASVTSGGAVVTSFDYRPHQPAAVTD